MLTKKHFEEIAAVINTQYNDMDSLMKDLIMPDMPSSMKPFHLRTMIRQEVLKEVAYGISKVLQQYNPQFNHDKFIDACFKKEKTP